MILVDEGMGTGMVAHAAVQEVRRSGAAVVVLAIPITSMAAMRRLRPLVDGLVYLQHDEVALSAAESYDDETPTSSTDVMLALARFAVQDGPDDEGEGGGSAGEIVRLPNIHTDRGK